jgi:hypothetical protein
MNLVSHYYGASNLFGAKKDIDENVLFKLVYHMMYPIKPNEFGFPLLWGLQIYLEQKRI